MKKYFIVDPYYSDSHRCWAESLQNNLNGEVTIFSLPPVYWKWRMEGSAISLAQKITTTKIVPDTFIVTDFLNLALFKSLLPKRYLRCQFILYMHENQLTYPISKKDTDVLHHRDNHYGFINYTSCLVSDHVIFNSHYHQNSFISALNELSDRLPEPLTVEPIEEKSSVIPLSLDTKFFNFSKPKSTEDAPPLIVWNHRWEYDKRPDVFLKSLAELVYDGVDFRLMLLGKMDKKTRSDHNEAFELLNSRIEHCGYVSSRKEYYQLLQNGDIIASTSEHDFFGVSMMEGMYAGCRPVLPADLAYPELVPKSLHQKVLYPAGHFKKALTSAIQSNWTEDDRSSLRRHIEENFTWATLQEKYDNLLG